jgi:NADP-dependent 3-hydroxy acid dehydrogenase YdfG
MFCFGRHCLSEEFARVIDVDPKGVHEVIWAFLPAMIARASR